MRQDKQRAIDSSVGWALIIVGCIFVPVFPPLGIPLVGAGAYFVHASSKNFARDLREKRRVVNVGRIADLDVTNRGPNGEIIATIEEAPHHAAARLPTVADLPTIVEEPSEPLLLTEADLAPTDGAEHETPSRSNPR